LDNLVNIPDAANDRILIKGGLRDKLLTKAITSIEASNSIPERTWGRLRDLGIILQRSYDISSHPD